MADPLLSTSALDLTRLQTSAPTVPRVQGREQAEKIAKDFEAMVLSSLLAPLFESLETDGLGGGGAGEQAFRPLLVQEYAKGIAANGGIGVADAVLKELLRAQGLEPEPVPRP
jgi:Rod binding domain-containing protein